METTMQSSHPKPILSQTENNTTLWIGHSKADPIDHVAGQTFTCPAEGVLNNIQLYSTIVNEPGELNLSLYEFAKTNNTWGSIIGTAKLLLQKGDNDKWIRFDLGQFILQKDATYGFRLHTDDAYVGLGEAAHAATKPFPFGLAWNADTNNLRGNFYRYFSLAFKVEMCA